jgi:translation initiation factor IF-2
MKAIKIYNSRELDRKVYKAVKEALADYKLDNKIINILTKLVKEGLNEKTFTLDKSLKSTTGTIAGDATVYANIAKAIKQVHKNIRASEFFKVGP